MRQGSIKLFTLFGIGVYVNWMWLIPAVWFVNLRREAYSSLQWSIIEVLCMFAIVLMHEFGHQLACRQVGGKTRDIYLWLFGGVAYVNPPQRPGAQLWSIAAGPLVNVILIPILSVLVSLSSHLGWYDTHLDLYELIHNVWWINVGLLVFNMMPIYPLDGGQILRSILWFFFGRANSLLIACIIGFIGLAGLIGLVLIRYLVSNNVGVGGWQVMIAFFIALTCWGGLREAWALGRMAKLPRRAGFACPSCRAAPPIGEIWRCSKCGKPFDIFLHQCACPHCASQFEAAPCFDCGISSPFPNWLTSPPSNN